MPVSEMLSLTITGDTSGDLTVDCSNGDPLPLSGLSADSQEIDVIGTAAAGTPDTLVTTTTAAVYVSTAGAGYQALLRYPASTAVTFESAGPGDQLVALAGTVTLAGDPSNAGTGSTPAGPTVFVDESATVLFTGTQYLSALNILPGGAARMAQYGSFVLNTDALDVYPSIHFRPLLSARRAAGPF
jgi:hypothetical protein